MAPPARDKKCGVSETLDIKRRVQKSTNNAGRAQPHALTRSVEKANAVVEKITAIQELQAVTSPSTLPSVPTMNVDAEWDSEQEPEIDDFPPLDSKTSQKRTADILDSSIWSQDNKYSQKEDVPAYNAMLIMKARGLLNLVGPYFEEIETEFPGASTGFLSIITDGISRVIRGEKYL